MHSNTEQFMERISSRIYSLQKMILLILVSAITLINIAQITGRYVFHFSLPWSEQVSVLLFIIIIMLGGSIAVRTDSEIKIAFFNFKSVIAQHLLAILVDVVSFVTVIFFVYSSVSFFQHALKFKQVISSVQISYAYVFIFLPIGFILIGLEKLFNIIRKIISMRNDLR